MSKIFIYAEVDTNDADYIGKLTEVSQKDLEIIKKISKFIDDNDLEYGNSEYRDCDLTLLEETFTETELDVFSDIFNGGEYGFHSISEITVIEGDAYGI
ncbi:MAG: hypothetical protein E6R13_06120 [Spirochaetes bacterium]|nr:MAG: hypothetical protein E6R13_06120 [Spirochaetota bacterium]